MMLIFLQWFLCIISTPAGYSLSDITSNFGMILFFSCHQTDIYIAQSHCLTFYRKRKCDEISWKFKLNLLAVVMKNSIFWDITSCSLLKVNRRFGGACRLHLQGRRIRQARACLPPAFTLILACLILRNWKWRRHAPPKRRLTFNRLHGVISQKIELLLDELQNTTDVISIVAAFRFKHLFSFISKYNYRPMRSLNYVMCKAPFKNYFISE
jgi:hypothetical protein